MWLIMLGMVWVPFHLFNFIPYCSSPHFPVADIQAFFQFLISSCILSRWNTPCSLKSKNKINPCLYRYSNLTLNDTSLEKPFLNIATSTLNYMKFFIIWSHISLPFLSLQLIVYYYTTVLSNVVLL